MNNLHLAVKKEIDRLTALKVMFTVYDIHRILINDPKNRGGGKKFYDNVRSWVRYYFDNGQFFGTYNNQIGYHLEYTPPPHVYCPIGLDIENYEPDALDPNLTVKAVVAAQPSVVKVLAVSVQGLYLYALVNKQTGERSYGSKSNSIGLYKTRNGPVQLLIGVPAKERKDYEIVKYKVLIKPVGH